MASWQAKVASSLIRATIKRKPAGDLERLIKVTRERLEPPKFLLRRVPRGARIDLVNENGVKGEWTGWGEKTDRTLYYVHGGGYVALSPVVYRAFLLGLARTCPVRTFAVDYRLAPEHVFPAAVEDAVAGYRWMLDQKTDPHRLIIGGDSAGGGLTMATLIAIRDQGLPMPAGAFCLSPWTDLAVTGKSIEENTPTDCMFYGEGVRRVAPVYLGDASPRNPLASPIYGDLTGLPPLLIYVSDSEVLRDDSIRLAEKARACGVETDLRVWSDLPHVWPVLARFGVPEAKAVVSEIGDFIRSRTPDA